MKLRILPILTLWLLVAAGAPAQTVIRIYQCVKSAAGSSGNLQAALERSIAGLDSVEFLDESSACGHTSALLHDLGRWVDGRYFLGLRNHYFAYLIVNGNRLNVEQIELKNEANARQAENLLSKHRLVIVTESGRTSYECFRQGALLIFLVAPYRGWTPETRALVETIKKNYRIRAAGK